MERAHWRLHGSILECVGRRGGDCTPPSGREVFEANVVEAVEGFVWASKSASIMAQMLGRVVGEAECHPIEE